MKAKMVTNPQRQYAGQWYVPIDHTWDGIPRYLHVDGIVRGSTFNGGEPSGYFATEAAAQEAIDAFRSKRAEAIK